MRHVPVIIVAATLAAATAWLGVGGEAASSGLPSVALMTFAVAAVSGPIR